MKTRIVSLFISVTLLLMSCGDSNKEKSLRTKYSADITKNAFLQPKLFEYDETVKNINANEAANIIKKIDFIYLFKPQNEQKITSTQITKTPECGVESNSIQIMSKNIMQIIVNINDTKCSQKINPLFNTNMKFYLNIHCSETDLSSYSSRSAYELTKIKTTLDICPNDKEQLFFLNIDMTLNNDQGLTARGIGALMSTEGKECVLKFENNTYYLDNCNYYSRTFIQPREAKTQTTELIVVKTHNLTGIPGGIYYNSGTLDLLINNWKGVLSYKPDNIVPSYEVSYEGTKAIGNYKMGIISITNDTPAQ